MRSGLFSVGETDKQRVPKSAESHSKRTPAYLVRTCGCRVEWSWEGGGRACGVERGGGAPVRGMEA